MPAINPSRLFNGEIFCDAGSVSFENGVITEIAGQKKEGIDAEGLLLCPGLIDIHMHGQKGLDSMRPGDITAMTQTQLQYGVTAFCPASVTDTDEATHVYLESVKEGLELQRGARVLGAYLEGPFLTKEVRGAHDEEKLRDPTPENYQRLVGEAGDLVVRITLAPEKPGAEQLIKQLYAAGIAVSVGHSAASAEQMRCAADLGIRSSTHTFNGMCPLHHRNPGVVGTVLTDDRIYAELIADLIHIHPEIIQLIYKAKGPERCYFCTDSIEAAGMYDGIFRSGSEVIEVSGKVARKNGGLAGSTLTMDQGLRNLVSIGIPMGDALRMATKNPADVLHRSDLGRIQPGAQADFVLFDSDLNVRAVYVRGICEYSDLDT